MNRVSPSDEENYELDIGARIGPGHEEMSWTIGGPFGVSRIFYVEIEARCAWRVVFGDLRRSEHVGLRSALHETLHNALHEAYQLTMGLRK